MKCIKPTCTAFIFALLSLAFVLPTVYAYCDVDVVSPDVKGDIISYALRNMENFNMVVNHSLYINGMLVFNGSQSLNGTQYKPISIEYAFAPGNNPYEVKIEAIPDCGPAHNVTIMHYIFEPYSCTDPYGIEGQDRCDYSAGLFMKCSNSMWESESQNTYCNSCPYHCGDRICSCGEVHSNCPSDCQSSCTEGYTSSYTCDGSVQKRAYTYANCTTKWIAQTLCQNGCYNGSCLASPEGQCGVQLVSFDYMNNNVEGLASYATVKAKNTGGTTTRINTSVWIDNVLKDFKYQNIVSGSEFTATLSYASSVGQHSITVKSKAGCGSEDSKSAYISTIPQTASQNPPVQPQPQPGSPKATLVSFYPSSIDMPLHSSRIIGISAVTSIPQGFRVSIEGVSNDWLQYSSLSYVSDENVIYIYLTPKSSGNYTLKITARPELENITFNSEIPVFVSQQNPVVPEGFLGGFWTSLGWVAIFINENPAVIVAAIVFALVVILIIGHMRLRRERWPF